MSGIDFDYGRAMKQAERLDEIAGQVRNSTAKGIEDAMVELRAGWEGEAAEEYIGKGMDLFEKVEGVAKDLEKAAETIRTIAARIDAAERAAAALVGK